MEEEKKEIEVEEEPKEEVKAEPAQGGMAEADKFVLISFILAVVAIVVCGGWFIGAIAGLIISIIALGRSAKAISSQATRNPFKVFARIVKPLAIAGLILSILSLIGWTIWFIFWIVAFIAAAAEAAADAAILVLLF